MTGRADVSELARQCSAATTTATATAASAHSLGVAVLIALIPHQRASVRSRGTWQSSVNQVRHVVDEAAVLGRRCRAPRRSRRAGCGRGAVTGRFRALPPRVCAGELSILRLVLRRVRHGKVRVRRGARRQGQGPGPCDRRRGAHIWLDRSRGKGRDAAINCSPHADRQRRLVRCCMRINSGVPRSAFLRGLR